MKTKVRVIDHIQIRPLYIDGEMVSSGITIPKGTIGETELEWSTEEKEVVEIVFNVNKERVVINIPLHISREKIEIYNED